MIADRAEGAVLLALAAIYWREAYRVPPYGISDPLGPSGFPCLLAAALGITGLVLVLRPTAGAPPPVTARRRVVTLFALLALYAALFGVAGFFAATTLFLAAAIVLLAPSWRWRVPVLAVALTIALWLLFVKILGVEVPVSPLGIL